MEGNKLAKFRWAAAMAALMAVVLVTMGGCGSGGSDGSGGAGGDEVKACSAYQSLLAADDRFGTSYRDEDMAIGVRVKARWMANLPSDVREAVAKVDELDDDSSNDIVVERRRKALRVVDRWLLDACGEQESYGYRALSIYSA
jgi:hypothetical protein